MDDALPHVIISSQYEAIRHGCVASVRASIVVSVQLDSHDDCDANGAFAPHSDTINSNKHEHKGARS